MNETHAIINKDEKIIWEGKPQFVPFLLGRTAGKYLLFYLGFFIVISVINSSLGKKDYSWWTIPLAILILLSLVLIPILIYNVFVYFSTFYTITSKRIIIQKGIVGRDFESVPLQEIYQVSVMVGFLDKTFGSNSGTLYFDAFKPFVFDSVSAPYEVSKLVKSQRK